MFDVFTDLFGCEPPEATILPAELVPSEHLPFEIPPDWSESASGGADAVVPWDGSMPITR